MILLFATAVPRLLRLLRPVTHPIGTPRLPLRHDIVIIIAYRHQKMGIPCRILSKFSAVQVILTQDKIDFRPRNLYTELEHPQNIESASLRHPLPDAPDAAGRSCREKIFLLTLGPITLSDRGGSMRSARGTDAYP